MAHCCLRLRLVWNQDRLFGFPLHHTPANRRNKAITSACQRLDVAGLVGGIVQRCAQSFHGGVEAVFKIDKRALQPEPFLQLLTGDQFPRSLQQHLQDHQWLALQAHAHSFFAQFPGVRTELVGAETYDIRFSWTSHSDRISRSAQYTPARGRRIDMSPPIGTPRLSTTSGVTYVSPGLH